MREHGAMAYPRRLSPSTRGSSSCAQRFETRVKHDLTHEGAKVYSSCLFAERFRLRFEPDTLHRGGEATGIELVKLC